MIVFSRFCKTSIDFKTITIFVFLTYAKISNILDHWKLLNSSYTHIYKNVCYCLYFIYFIVCVYSFPVQVVRNINFRNICQPKPIWKYICRTIFWFLSGCGRLLFINLKGSQIVTLLAYTIYQVVVNFWMRLLNTQFQLKRDHLKYKTGPVSDP